MKKLFVSRAHVWLDLHVYLEHFLFCFYHIGLQIMLTTSLETARLVQFFCLSGELFKIL